MVEKELLGFVKHVRSQGKDDSYIEKILVRTGWPIEKIRAALESVPIEEKINNTVLSPIHSDKKKKREGKKYHFLLLSIFSIIALILLVSIFANFIMGFFGSECKALDELGCTRDPVIKKDGTIAIEVQNNYGENIGLLSVMSGDESCENPYVKSIDGLDLIPRILEKGETAQVLIQCKSLNTYWFETKVYLQAVYGDYRQKQKFGFEISGPVKK